MLPSCGCSQFNCVVGTGPRFRRSTWTASSSLRRSAALLVSAVQTSVGPIASSIFASGHCDDGHEREHVFLLRDRRFGRVAVDDGRQQVVGAALLHERGWPSRYFAVTSVTPGACEVGVDRLRDRLGDAGHGERREAGVRMLRRQRLDLRPAACAIASAISRVWRLAQMPEQLMQPRPLFRNTLSTITSRNSSQRSTSSSPIRIFENPGPCAWTLRVAAIAIDGRLCRRRSWLRSQLSSTAAPTSPPPG